MKVAALMTTDVVSVRPDASYKDVVEELVAHGISGLPVVADDGTLVGVVTEADVLARRGYGDHGARALAVLADLLSGREHHWATKAYAWRARDLMTSPVVSCTPQTDVQTAARVMLDRGINRLLVVEDGRLVGVVARQDILRALVRPDDEIAADVVRMLTRNRNRPDGLHVDSSVTDGKVVLTGTVQYPEDAEIVEDMVRRVPGVIGVERHLRPRERSRRATPPPWRPWVTPVR